MITTTSFAEEVAIGMMALLAVYLMEWALRCMGVPFARAEWYFASPVLVNLVWLYLEILRMLGRLRR